MGHGVRHALWAAVVAAATCATFWAAPAGAQVADDYRVAGELTPNQTFGQANDVFTSTGEPLAAGSMEFCGTAMQGFQIDRTFWGTIRGTGGPITVSTKTTPSVNTALAIYQANLLPTFANLLGCNNDTDDPAAPTAAKLTFNSVEGATHYLQFGSCAASAPTACAATMGTIHYTVLTNDSPGYASRVGGPRSNIGATADPGEPSDCKGTPHGASVWFAYQAPTKGSVSFDISAGPHVITVHRGGGVFDCGVAAGGPAQVVVPNAIRGEQFLVQVGGAISGGAAAESWFSHTRTFTPGPDQDEDGFSTNDCNDANPAINPAAVDVPGNGIDEDCTKGDERRRLDSVVEATANRRGRMTKFRARRVPKGATIKLRCSRRSCLRRTSIRATATTVNLLNTLRTRALRANTTITVTITLPNWVGRVGTVKVNSRRRVTVTNASAPS